MIVMYYSVFLGMFYKYLRGNRIHQKPTLTCLHPQQYIFAQAAWNYYDSRSFSKEEQESWNAQKKKSASSIADQNSK